VVDLPSATAAALARMELARPVVESAPAAEDAGADAQLADTPSPQLVDTSDEGSVMNLLRAATPPSLPSTPSTPEVLFNLVAAARAPPPAVSAAQVAHFMSGGVAGRPVAKDRMVGHFHGAVRRYDSRRSPRGFGFIECRPLVARFGKSDVHFSAANASPDVRKLSRVHFDVRTGAAGDTYAINVVLHNKCSSPGCRFT